MPIIGISHGFSPIAGFNYGAELYRRVKGVLKEGFIWTAVISIAGFILMMVFPQFLIGIFTNDPQIIKNGVMPLRFIAIFAPMWGIPIMGGAFFQAIGKARPALIINLARQLLIFIPSVILLPLFFDLLGVWMSWPFTDFFSVIISGIFMIREIKVINKMIGMKESQGLSVRI